MRGAPSIMNAVYTDSRVRARLLCLALVACSGDKPSSRPGGDAGHEVRDTAACLAALQQRRSATAVSDACRALYREPLCESAWDSNDAGRIAQACAFAYCGILPKPRPYICDHPDNYALDYWSELNAAILSHELGPLLAKPLIEAMTVPAGHVVTIDPAGALTLDGAAIGIDELPIALSMSKMTSVTVKASSAVPYSTVVDVIDRIRAAGISQVQIAP